MPPNFSAGRNWLLLKLPPASCSFNKWYLHFTQQGWWRVCIGRLLVVCSVYNGWYIYQLMISVGAHSWFIRYFVTVFKCCQSFFHFNSPWRWPDLFHSPLLVDTRHKQKPETNYGWRTVRHFNLTLQHQTWTWISNDNNIQEGNHQMQWECLVISIGTIT